MAGDEVGLYAQDEALRIAIEKDFRCLTRAEEEPDAYPHPSQRLPSKRRIMPITIGAKRESDFTDPIGMLGDCHRRIERFLNVLVVMAAQEKGGLLAEQHRTALATSLQYFREAAPKHAADEEESLFPRLRRIDPARTQAILARIDCLEQDHECAGKAHDEVDRLGQLWLTRGQLSPKEASRLSTLLDQLAKLYRNHIAIEDKEVFPFAASMLPPSDGKSVGAEMAARRGAGVAIPTLKSR